MPGASISCSRRSKRVSPLGIAARWRNSAASPGQAVIAELGFNFFMSIELKAIIVGQPRALEDSGYRELTVRRDA